MHKLIRTVIAARSRITGHGRTHRIVATMALFFALSGTVAVAVTGIPGADGTIQGCYADATGQLRVVADAAQCRANESRLPWNQQGPKGDKGDTGEPDGSMFVERLFAVVRADGTVRAQRGLVSITKDQTGFYTLTFDRDVRDCAVVGSQGARNNGFAGNRIISVNKAPQDEIKENVNVRTQFFGHDGSGSQTFMNEDWNFDVQVTC